MGAKTIAERLAEAATETYAPALAELDRKIEEFFQDFEREAAEGTSYERYFDFVNRGVPPGLRKIARLRIGARAEAEGLSYSATTGYVNVIWSWGGGGK